jgi:predicted ribosomally synthesized peptide with nif11-like leader
MSYESCAEFARKIGTDEQLAGQVAAATANLGSIRDRTDAISKLGAGLGFEFSTEEALGTFISARKADADGAELGDEELELVAGGTNPNSAFIQKLFSPTGGDVRSGVGAYADYLKFVLG